MAGIGKIFRAFLSGSKVDIALRYEILREAVSGTMSDFVMARDRESGDIVGLKVLDKQKTEFHEARFKGLSKPTEGEIAMQIEHPHVVKTLLHGVTTKNEQYLVMEFLDGPGLNSLIIGRSKLLDGNRLALMRQAAEGLDAVHKAGFIHRDICPRNFVCSKDATSLKLIDFGLTVPAEKEYMQPGNRTGTPNYMAPEVVRRRPTDKRLDIYSFGASMYEMFAFELPWQRGADGRAAMTHGANEIPPLSHYYPPISPELERLILHCLETEPAKRPSSMETICNTLKRMKHEDVAP
ncbi:Serine/threonine-protein kinase StkP [Pseudobythopirellula maris]|uniref:Serine/threonine-protein kinase StkP n=1 Tax=Pseudobythopirellula maris TaxID=2527991 RepID=A0A5C5ZPH1_9BACT|nr:serine/threonine-protein kinase [Pseudobythopirellula maris]TWT89015.1 Serine/threonine-protein kinase StkP [Pseudobythopirellula maris]